MKRLAIILVCLAACGKSDSSGGKKGGRSGGPKLEYPVDVATLEVRQVQYTVDAPGSIEAFQQVQITSRVQGAVDKVAFVEGQQVKAGDVLVVIESARYEIAVAQARAIHQKAQATQAAAEAALQRRLNAQKDSPGLVPGEEIEQKRTAVDTAKADVEQARQAVRIAELNLRESRVSAPIAGVVQTRTVQQGQYLSAGTVLATILQRNPLLLRFQVTELDAPRLQNGMTATVRLKNNPKAYTAKLTLVAGAADMQTRMVPITAQLDAADGDDGALRPGAFCAVTIPIGEERRSIVVPTLAVAPTEQGNVVFIVDDKGFARARVVQLGMRTAEGGVELTSGVKEGETMVIRGIEPLSEGAPVRVKSKITLEQAEKAADQNTTPTEGSAALGGKGSGAK